jgi:alpha-N-arabinofuranosidase
VPNRRQRRTFENPVLRGFQPDPSICRVGHDFYLVTSSFEYFPGIPIFHSKDLVHWRQLGHVLTRKSQLDLTRTPSSRGIYAPTLRHHRGLFYVVTTHVDCGGNFYVTARRPEGPWSEPRFFDAGGFDPSFTFEDGRCYYLRDGEGRDRSHPRVYQTTLDLRTGKLEAKLRPIWSGTGGIWPEGAHLYRRGEFYYLFAAEGGTSYGHAEVVGRSRSPFGPFEAAPNNPILTHRYRPRHPIQAIGHADFVELDDGSSYAVFLGIRPLGRRRHHLGRETFLAPMSWDREGWPTIGRRGRVELRMPAPALPPHRFPPRPARDRFDGEALDPKYVFLRNPEPGAWSLAARPGFLRLSGTKTTLDELGSPAFVGARQEAFELRCRTRVEFVPVNERDEAGLVVRGNEQDYYALAIRRTQAGRTAILRQRCAGKSRNVGSARLAAGPVELEIVATKQGYTFFATAGRKRKRLGTLPSRGLAAETIGRAGANHFTGVVLGVYATGNGARAEAPADFAWFELRPKRRRDAARPPRSSKKSG